MTHATRARTLPLLWWLLPLGIFGLTQLGMATATKADEIKAQSVKIKMYDLKSSKWTSSLSSTFSSAIATAATRYCASFLSACGLDAVSNFTSSEVSTTSPSNEGSSIVFKFRIEYPSGSVVTSGGTTQYIVPSAAASAIAASARDEAKSQTGHYITYIGDDYYSVPPDAGTNKVIIPIAFGVVISAMICAAALHCHEKRQARTDKLRRRMDDKKRSGGSSFKSSHHANTSSSAGYNILETTSTNTSTSTTTAATPWNTTPRYSNWSGGGDQTAKVAPIPGQFNYATWHSEKETPTTKSMSYGSYPSASVNDCHPDTNYNYNNGEMVQQPALRGQRLRPLQQQTKADDAPSDEDGDEEEATKKERKRRRKERKREKRRHQASTGDRDGENGIEMYDNQGLDNSVMSDPDNVRSRSNNRPTSNFSAESGAVED